MDVRVLKGAKSSDKVKTIVGGFGYYRGIFNLINLYMPVCDTWLVVDNRLSVPISVAEGRDNANSVILNDDIWTEIVRQSKVLKNE